MITGILDKKIEIYQCATVEKNMLQEYCELHRSELNTLRDMGGEKPDRVARDPHRRLRVKQVLRNSINLVNSSGNCGLLSGKRSKSK